MAHSANLPKAVLVVSLLTRAIKWLVGQNFWAGCLKRENSDALQGNHRSDFLLRRVFSHHITVDVGL